MEVDVRSSLQTGYFKPPESDRIASAAPLLPVQIMLTLDQIRPYERNPRQADHPRYEELKASIAAVGIRNPFTVTQRPGDDHYIIEAGGNTRLRILNELWRETGDERFWRVQVLFKPWPGDVSVLSAHIAENELRGEMCFADKAQAIHSLKKVVEEECGESLSWREFERMLPERGLTLSHAQLARMKDLVEILADLMPDGLLRSLGPHHVQTIKSAFSEWASYAGEKLSPFLRKHEDAIREGFMSCDDDPSKIVSALQRIRKEIPVQPEPDEASAASQPAGNVTGKASSFNTGDDGQTSRPTPEPIRLLQRIIMLRPRNYELAMALADGRANVRPYDSGFGFELGEGDAARLGDKGFLAAISAFRPGRDSSISLSAWCRLNDEDADRLLELLRNIRHIVQATLRTKDATSVSDPFALDNVLIMETQNRLDSGAGA
jgi:ParB family protein of integrating conjugative element (PFGI_1 class)